MPPLSLSKIDEFIATQNCKKTAYLYSVSGENISHASLAANLVSQILRAQVTEQIEAKIAKDIEEVKTGDLSSIEAILVAQTHLLNALFISYVARLDGLIQEGAVFEAANANVIDNFAKLTLKLQASAVKTAKIIADLKIPKHTAFVRQLNQQNNVRIDTHAQMDSRSTEKTGTEDKRVEALEQSQAVEVSPSMETVGVLDRCKNP